MATRYPVVTRKSPAQENAKLSARSAGLRYVSDQTPGINRKQVGRNFRYFRPRGGAVRDASTLKRIRALAIPPAWTDVWICVEPAGHLQVVGRDARKRKQYRYHARWREVRDENKFNRMIDFGRLLPKIRSRVRRDLRGNELERPTILAAVVRLLELSALRIGNDEYAEQNDSYGITTFRHHHAQVRGATIKFNFRGKSGKRWQVSVEHRRLARIVRRCQDLPGQDLFQYLDDSGKVRDVTSGDVNTYLAEITGRDFTAKDFRTWTGTVLAALALQKCEPVDSQSKAKRNLVRAVEQVAQRLGNTPAICKKCYIHPAIFESYLDGALAGSLRTAGTRGGLRPEEAGVITLLRRRLKTTDDKLSQQLRKSLRVRGRKA